MDSSTSGLAELPSKVATGRTAVIAGFTFDEFQYDLALPKVLLDLGSWWVALHHGPLSFVVVDQFSWQQTVPNATSGTAVGSPVQNTGVPWNRSNTHSAFQLGGEPAPEAIIASVQGLSLSDGEKNSLIGKLQAAQASLGSARSHAAHGQLKALINEIRALAQSERLNSQTASSMIASAEAILAKL